MGAVSGSFSERINHSYRNTKHCNLPYEVSLAKRSICLA